MTNYKSPLCSCIIGRKEYSAKGIHTHYINKHTDIGQARVKMGGSITFRRLNAKSKEFNLTQETEYNMSPRKCDYCDNFYTFKCRNNKFCSQSCAATYNNSIRSRESREQQAIKLKESLSKTEKKRQPVSQIYSKISYCEVCSVCFQGTRKTCSKLCYKKLLSIKVNQRIDLGWNPQENRCKSSPSYLELSFENWLISNNFTEYIKNKTFRCNNKIYYGDFFFPTYNLLIELDGKQHEQSKEYDNLRDELIKKYHTITTLRISHKEFISKSKIELVKNLLNIH